jgi:hypothetical protein
LRECVIEVSQTLRNAIMDANARLTDEGVRAFDADDEDDRTKAVAPFCAKQNGSRAGSRSESGGPYRYMAAQGERVPRLTLKAGRRAG